MKNTPYLEELYAHNILDTPNEPLFQNIAKLTTLICNTPHCYINIIDKNRQWTKACTSNEQYEVSLNHSFCIHTVTSEQSIFIVSDPAQDPRFANNPFVDTEGGIKFYAGVPIKTSAGVAVGALCVTHNQPHVLNDTQIEALKLLGLQVNALLEERTAKIQFEKEKITAELKTRIKQLMLSMLTHEIKSPLINISLILDLFKNDLINREELLQLVEDSKERVDVINNSVEKMLLLGNKSLQSEGRQMELCYIKDFIKGIFTPLVHQCAAKNNTLSYESDVTEQVYLDVSGLQMVITNLVINANKFTENGSISIYVHKSGEALLIKVTDDGRGMDKSMIASILNCEMLTSLRGTRNERGTGLGLLLANDYLKCTNGKMYISSSPGKGSTFTLEINEVQFVKEAPEFIKAPLLFTNEEVTN